MIDILERSAVRQRVHPLSVETYHVLGEAGHLGTEVELLRGVIVQKMPKSPLHTSIAQLLVDALRLHCKG